MKTERKRIEDLKPAAYNPRVMLEKGDPDYEKLKNSIQKFGHVQPIVWNKRTGNVVGGHQSLKVLSDLGETDVDCVVVDLPLAEEKTLNIALNKISGRWDMEKLSAIMEELVDEGLEIYTGYEAREIDQIMKELVSEISEERELNTADFEEAAFEHKCPRCGFLF